MANSHPSFSDASADAILQSTEGTMYHIHSAILRNTSRFFLTMLSLPQPDDIKAPDVIPVSEKDVVMERVLRMMCGLEIPRWTSFDELESALDLIEKWDAPGPLSYIRSAIMSPIFADEPLRVYVLTTHYGWEEETAASLVQTLKVELLSGEYDLILRRLSSKSLLDLVAFHHRCKTRFQQAMDSTALFTGGNQEPSHCACGERRDNSAWRALRTKILSEFNRRPLGDHILVNISGCLESVACWSTKCVCGSVYYNQASTIENIKLCIKNA
ncbi:hypothetical protein GGX14DRAFT_2703, partial [Mycena pura]